MNPRIINIHAHQAAHNESLDSRVQAWRQEGVRSTCLSCLGGPWSEAAHDGYFTNEQLAPFLKKYPDDLIGMAYVNADTYAGRVDWKSIPRFRELGFKGLKLITPSAPYDHEQFFPIYDQAQRLGMPILFHTGLCSIPADDRMRHACNEFMRPSHLERIARYFPALNLIGAHLGNGFEEEALHMLSVYPNVFFDLTGASGKKSRVSRLKKILSPFPGANLSDPEENPAHGWFEKIVFGTDNPPVETWRRNYVEIMDYLAIPEATREKVFHGNAARIFKLAE